MKTREMLELAAKAAGIYGVDPVGDDDLWSDGTLTYQDENGEYQTDPVGMRLIGGIWNPRDDDGDALRLAVKLGLFIQLHESLTEVTDGVSRRKYEAHNGDPYAATRLAILRAAAEIGKAM